ncbi:type IX secretion system membrane protein PorP/SprF [uncultured Cytophaga sp.]|uniref:PorP/SprF family type IX secretion system membrane protein n=1 Tax=uncultured Cytophaga sp. TaxID=160238 RepID=UPI002606E1B7|nr:type IX secretion system membrane protein PorP/SprF [uncultured Cytophaga sp.]
MFSKFHLRFTLLIAIIATFYCNTAKAQDIQFSQFYAVPLYHNPAFAGSVHAPRATVHTRLQWLGLDANYKTYYASGDTYLAKYKSGLGFQVLHDIQGSSVYSSTQFSFIYSYEIPVSKTFTARLGLQASGIQRTLNYNGLRFPGQFDDPNGFVGGPTNQPTGIQNQLYADIGAGTLVYSDRMWGGFSVEHLNTPVQSFAGATKDNLPMNFQLTGGYKIPLSQRKYLAYTEDKSEISITPTFHYKSQGKSDQLDIGLYGMYNQLMAGVWYRGIPIKHYDKDYKIPNRESVVFLLGWMYKTWSFGYSYDLTISKLTAAGPGGSHEFNITYIHKPVKKHKPMRRLPCPSFYKH